MRQQQVAIIGSHGLYASYGGWDQLVNNLVELRSGAVQYVVYNSVESQRRERYPKGVKVIHLPWKASGLQGMLYDYFSIFQAYWKSDAILLLGVQGIPLLFLLLFFRKTKIVGNVGGIEWERPKFNIFAKLYLKFCFFLAAQIADTVILDNEHYGIFLPKNMRACIHYIPYGGYIDTSKTVDSKMLAKYSFLSSRYFLSISRAIADNQVAEICEYFSSKSVPLVMISNFSSSEYGRNLLEKYNANPNLVLIDGLYQKDELDLVRRNCLAYIHTHTLCGTAPSLVEMVMTGKPIISIDIPQNRYTLNNEGAYFKSFGELDNLINSSINLEKYIPHKNLRKKYEWIRIVRQYEATFTQAVAKA